MNIYCKYNLKKTVGHRGSRDGLCNLWLDNFYICKIITIFKILNKN